MIVTLRDHSRCQECGGEANGEALCSRCERIEEEMDAVADRLPPCKECGQRPHVIEFGNGILVACMTLSCTHAADIVSDTDWAEIHGAAAGGDAA